MPLPWPHVTNHYACLMQQTHDGPSTMIFYPLPLPCPISATLGPIPSLFPTPHPAPMPTTSRHIQCYPSIDCVLLYPVYVCYIVILFVSLTDKATIKGKRFICSWKESRVRLCFVVKSKLVTVLSLFLRVSASGSYDVKDSVRGHPWSYTPKQKPSWNFSITQIVWRYENVTWG